MRTLLIVFLLGLVSLCAANERKSKHTTQGFRRPPMKHPEPALECNYDDECKTEHDHPCKLSTCENKKCHSSVRPGCPTDDACEPGTSYCPSNWRCVPACGSCPKFPVQAGPGQCGQRCMHGDALCRETHRCVADCHYCQSEKSLYNYGGVCISAEEHETESMTEETSSTVEETSTTEDHSSATSDFSSSGGCRDNWNEDVWMQITMAENLQRYALALQLVYKNPDGLPPCAVTLLAPTDAAFHDLPEETYFALFTDMELLKSFVDLTIIPGEQLLSEGANGKRDALSIIMETKYTLREENAVAFFVKAGEYCVGGPGFQDFTTEYNTAKIDMENILEFNNGNVLPIDKILIPKHDGCMIAPGWPSPRCGDPDDSPVHSP